MFFCMRTTLQIDDQLMRAAKKAAAESGRTLTSVVEDALRLALFSKKQDQASEPFKLPVFSLGQPLPGVNLDSNAELLELMEADNDPV
jgi:hypothetical protein